MTINTLDETICNLKFYEVTNGYKDNTVKIENLSGRSVSWMANAKFIKTKDMKLRLETTGSNSEYSSFWTWFESIGGCAGVFTCSALGSDNWRFSSIPSEDNGQKYKELTINLEQVYA